MPRALNLADVMNALQAQTNQALSPVSDLTSTELLSQIVPAGETCVMSDAVTLSVGSPAGWDGGVWGEGLWT